MIETIVINYQPVGFLTCGMDSSTGLLSILLPRSTKPGSMGWRGTALSIHLRQPEGMKSPFLNQATQVPFMLTTNKHHLGTVFSKALGQG
jgi:hypothetical protein